MYELTASDYLEHIPKPPICHALPHEGFEHLKDFLANPEPHLRGVTHKEAYIGCRDGNLCEITDPIFEGVNPSNLKDTSRVKLKGFTWNGWCKYEANQDEVRRANEDFPQDILRLYKFHAKYDPNIYNKSIGILSAAEQLQKILKELTLDLKTIQETIIETSMIYEPHDPEYNREILLCLDLPNVFILDRILALVKQVQEEQADMFKATYTGDNLGSGFSQMSEATNNVAISGFAQAEATLAAGRMMADAMQQQADAAQDANDIEIWGERSKLTF